MKISKRKDESGKRKIDKFSRIVNHTVGRPLNHIVGKMNSDTDDDVVVLEAPEFDPKVDDPRQVPNKLRRGRRSQQANRRRRRAAKERARRRRCVQSLASTHPWFTTELWKSIEVFGDCFRLLDRVQRSAWPQLEEGRSICGVPANENQTGEKFDFSLVKPTGQSEQGEDADDNELSERRTDVADAAVLTVEARLMSADEGTVDRLMDAYQTKPRSARD